MSTVNATYAETRMILENVRWETYIELADQRRGSVPRMTYDEGTLELMSPRRQHERIGRLLGRMIETFTEVQGIEIQSVASTTFKRRDLKKGFEADESYYVEHADQVRDKEEVDLAIDPPPDLVIEVEITASAIQKMSLFASMGVPEVWRHDGDHLMIQRLGDDGYQQVDASVCLPGFSIPLAEAFLSRRMDEGETSLIRAFRQRISEA